MKSIKAVEKTVIVIEKAHCVEKPNRIGARLSRLSGSNNDDGSPKWELVSKVELERPEPMVEFESSLRWYIEDFSIKEPFEEGRAKKIRSAIGEYGSSLFSQLRLAEVAAETSASTIEVHVLEDLGGTEWGSIHWESLESPVAQSPSCANLFIQVSRVSTINAQPGPVQVISGPKEALNMLVIVSRPDDLHDIGYRKVTLPLINATEIFPHRLLCADVVGMGTWKSALEALDAKPFGHYAIVHFDAHGQIRKHIPCLRFRRRQKSEFVPAEDIASKLMENGVQAVILNSCSSAKTPRPTQDSLALALLRHGMRFVIGMAYDVHEDAVFQFVQGLYRTLLDGQSSVLDAVAQGRRAMQDNTTRVGKFNLPVDVEDWLNPVLYCRDPSPSKLITLPQDSTIRGFMQNPDTTDWNRGFYGRDWDIMKIERGLVCNKLVRIEGFRGSGKSTLTRHIAEWWRRTNFAEAVFIVDFSSTHDSDTESPHIYPTEIFKRIDAILAGRDGTSPNRCRFYQIGPSENPCPAVPQPPDCLTGYRDGINLGQAMAQMDIGEGKIDDDAALFNRLKLQLCSNRYVVIFNDFHNVSSLASGGDMNRFAWIEEMIKWLKRLEWRTWKSAILFSSMLQEDWLDELTCEIVTLHGIDPVSATQLAQRIVDIEMYTKDALDRDYLERIMAYFDYQPLALQIILPQLVRSQLSPVIFFEQLLLGEVEVNLDGDVPIQHHLIIEFIVALQALPTWIPGIDAVQLRCPQEFIREQLDGQGVFEAQEDPQKVWKDTLETLQDFGIVRLLQAEDQLDILTAGDLEVHPLFPAFLRFKSPDFAASTDMMFSYLVHYLALQSYDWSEDGYEYKLSKSGARAIQDNQFNILAALQYCISRPYLWDTRREREFGLLMKPISYYAIFHKPSEKNVVSRIERGSIDKIARAFSDQEATALTPWWKAARLALTEVDEDAASTIAGETDEDLSSPTVTETDEDDSSLDGSTGLISLKETRILQLKRHTVMPKWIYRRVITTYCYLRFGAWKTFDPIGWDYNAMLMGLLAWRRAQLAQVPQEFREENEQEYFDFLEQESKICAAEFTYQSGNHRVEGMKVLAEVDLSCLSGAMRETLEVRLRDIRAELMGFLMDADHYQGDADTMKQVMSAEADGKFPGGGSVAGAIITRRAYETACRTKNKDDIKRAKDFIYQSLSLVDSPEDPYPIVLHRFLYDVSGIPSTQDELQVSNYPGSSLLSKKIGKAVSSNLS